MIKVLDKHVADKIAAGEVVERPLSVIKELIENSIDANAKSIIVEIKNGGKSYIRITDDGVGIPKDEVETAFLRHATSKVSTSSDLNHIATLGFRGEALAGISAVTRTEIITRVEGDNSGTHLIMYGGKLDKKESIGCSRGTTFIISDLFYNTPARKKFLKNDNVEGALIIKLLSNIALAFAHIRIKLISNGNILFSTNGNGDKFSAITSIYKQDEYRHLLSIDYYNAGCRIEGYISSPNNTKTTRKYQTFFVNGRYIDSKVIEKAVDLGYKERLFEGRYPIVFLFVQISPSELDVNIHPTKKEIRFDDDAKIIAHIETAIKQGLMTSSAIPEIKSKPSMQYTYKESLKSYANELSNNNDNYQSDKSKEIPSSLLSNDSLNNKAICDSIINAEVDKFEEKESALCSVEESLEQVNIIEELSLQKYEEKRESSFIAPPAIVPFDIDDLEVIGVVFGTYIVAVLNQTIYYIDQHAAHERILYEHFINQYESDQKNSQMLLIPLVKDIDMETKSYFDFGIDLLSKIGYVLEEFGENSYVIKEMPTFMTLEEGEQFFDYFVDNIHLSSDIKNITVVDKLIMISCKSAIKANDIISDMEIKSLLDDLKLCINPYSCPHGRPTFIKMTKYEIEKMFKRV